jgi:inosine-uridine nucleoside N-ribohydrolase
MKASMSCLLGLLLVVAPAPAQELVRPPILLDTDIGNDMDDALALALLLASPEIDLRGVVATGTEPGKRAMFLCRFLTMTGRRQTAVATGSAPPVERKMVAMHQYYYHPDVLFNRTTKPVKEPAFDFINARVRAQPKRVTLLATGPLTNVARFLSEHPKSAALVRRIVLCGENVKADAAAARKVFNSGVPLIVLLRDVTEKLTLSVADRKSIFAPATALSLQTQALFQLTDERDPPLGDVLAAAVCLDERFCAYEDRNIEVDNEGVMQFGKGRPNAKVATKVDREKFLKWYVGRMASCVAPSERPAKPVERGGFPNRVHVAEDFDTDIERRWWMAGVPETKNLPSRSKRACRGVLTHDFDDLLGNPKAMHTAVIFNPVPGPPMGKNTRLNFRCFLDGTDTLRVQIYSLTNHYHRHLILKGLPEKKWQMLTVDMTQARRPDGTGGPLSEGERIDDIQFYVSPKAGLLIDDIFLYDAAVEGEKRPFPKKVHYTGWFDSGKQGREWPGTFEIVPNKGAFWHAAKTVADKDGVSIKLGLRGQRRLGAKTHLRFRYLLSGGERVTVWLVGDRGKVKVVRQRKDMVQGRWGEATFDLSGQGPVFAEELHLYAEKGAELLVDDVLLYEPGE